MKIQTVVLRVLLAGSAALLFLPATFALAPPDKTEDSNKPPIAQPDDGPGKPQNSAHDKQAEARASCSTARLKIVVRGEGKPVSQATVRVAYAAADAAAACADGNLAPTNPMGEVVFSSSGKGELKILVIAPGWETGRSSVQLKEGQQTTTVELKHLPVEGSH